MRVLLVLFFWVMCLAVFSQENLSAGDFFTVQDTTEQMVLLDVRPYELYQEERIPGAVFAGEEKVLMKLINNYDFSTPVLLYCEIGKRSKKVSIILKKEGFRELYNLEQGFRDWKSKGFPVDNEKID
jgi:rhodanese-related sulfurtransferase